MDIQLKKVMYNII
jgi:hypothetical protein